MGLRRPGEHLRHDCCAWPPLSRGLRRLGESLRRLGLRRLGESLRRLGLRHLGESLRRPGLRRLGESLRWPGLRRLGESLRLLGLRRLGESLRRLGLRHYSFIRPLRGGVDPYTIWAPPTTAVSIFSKSNFYS